MKRLAYLRSEASESVDDFDSAVKDIESQIGKDKGKSPDPPTASGATESRPSHEEPRDIIPSRGGDPPKESRDNGRTQGESGSEGPEVQDPQGDPVSVQYKKLWRAIARMTHPDVVGDDPEMTALYKAAAAAAERGRREELLDVSSELSIHLADPHPTLLDDVERRCVHYEALIRKVRASVAWQWKHSGEEAKAEIVDLILKSREKS
jgi:hypothetical protein